MRIQARDGPQSIAPSGLRHLKCTMRGGPDGRRVYSFTVDPAQKMVWTEADGDYLRILRLDEQRIEVATVLPYSDLSEHHYVNFHSKQTKPGGGRKPEPRQDP